MSDIITPEEVDTIVAEAKAGFGLRDRIKGRKLRTGKIVLFTDEEAGAELGSARTLDDKVELSGVVLKEATRVREGVLGEIDALGEHFSGGFHQEEFDRLCERRDELIATLKATSIELHIRAVPTVALEASDRFAVKQVGGKRTEENAADYTRAQVGYLLEHAVTYIKDNASGDERASIVYDDALALREYLPRSEYARLDILLGRVQYANAVAESVTDSADF